MGNRVFRLTFEVTATLELNDAVIDVVDDEWRKSLYDLYSAEDIAGMIGRMMLKGFTLSQLDGWADQPDSNAKFITAEDWDQLEVKEITTGKK